MQKLRGLLSSKSWLLGILLLIALLIRLNHLTDRSLWFDEAFSWRLIQFPFLEFLSRSASDVHPILYYILLWLWCAPLYLLKLTISLFWLRFFSVILSLGTVAATYFAGKTLFQSKWIGITAALLMAVNAFQIQYAWEARMYALGTFLLCLCLIFLIKTINANKKAAWRNGIIFGLLTGALFHVHYFMLFSITAIFLFVILHSLLEITKNNSSQKRSILPLIVGLFLAVIIFMPWFPIFLKQRAQVQQNYWILPMDSWSIPDTMSRLLLGGVNDFPHETSIICSGLVFFILLTPLVLGRKKSDLLLFLSFLVPFAGSWWISRSTSIYQDRYFVFASVALILLIARCISFLPTRFYFRSVIAILLTCYGFYNVTQFWSSMHFQDHPGMIAAAKYIEENASRCDEPIVISSSFIYFPIAFHLPTGERYGIASIRDFGNTCLATPKLYSKSGEFSHFGGSPILTKNDMVSSEVFQKQSANVWVIDTTGFYESKLDVPATYKLADEKSFSELFVYQGDIIVRKYIKISND